MAVEREQQSSELCTRLANDRARGSTTHAVEKDRETRRSTVATCHLAASSTRSARDLDQQLGAAAG